MTLIELLVAIFISFVLLATAYQAQRYFVRGSEHEKRKAQLQHGLLTYCEMIEKDVRMAGFGLPGNGLELLLSNTQSDELRVFLNTGNHQTVLSSEPLSTDHALLVGDATGASENGWVCLAGAADTIYREIARAGFSATAADTLYLTAAIGAGSFPPTGALVYPATRIRYLIASAPGGGLVRMKNHASVQVCDLIDTLDIIPRDVAGAVVSGSASLVRALTVSLGGRIQNGSSSSPRLIESIGANVRNHR